MLTTHVLNDPDQVFEKQLPLLVGDDSCRDVAKNVRTASLDSIQITAIQRTSFSVSLCLNHSLLFVEEVLDDFVLALWVVEVDKETPVDEPCSVLQSHQVRGACLHVHDR